MYAIIQKKGRDNTDFNYDYIFKDFKQFYEIADTLTYSIFGRYKIKIVTEDIEEAVKFIKHEDKYQSLDIHIYMPEAAIDYIQQRDTKINIQGSMKDIDIFKELISNKNILFEKGVMYILYNSIPHNLDSMEKALNTIVFEFGVGVPVSEKMLNTLFVLNKMVYPRTVLISFIQMERYRWVKFEKSISAVGNQILLGAMIKNMKQFIRDKVVYYKTGRASSLIKSLNTNNLMLLYRVLVSERNGFNDAKLLLTLYERGISAHDILQ